MTDRAEKDSLGEVRVPAKAYWGAQTQRAIQNFQISGLKPDSAFVRAYAHQKKASAEVNVELGLLEPRLGKAIVGAADEILAGRLMDQFVVDPFQAGAGTSHHMNMNEVLANRANEILGGKLGTYSPVHPNDHVNLGQSTNDTFPTAMRLAILLRHPDLETRLKETTDAFNAKGDEFEDIVTAGRTHLQDATPITLGQVMHGYAGMIARVLYTLHEATEPLCELGIGGTAVGTGVNRHPEYPQLVCKKLTQALDLELTPAGNLIAHHASTQDFARYASALKGAALELSRIANDLRLMSSGPTSGIGEIDLPPVQPGSSIMPGKVNPVMAENLNMVCFQVAGAETTVAMASEAGQFQLNVMMPVIIYEILFSMTILTRALAVFRERCLLGITAHTERARGFAERTVSLATMLTPLVGYERAAEIVKRAVRENRSIVEVAAEELGQDASKLREVLDPMRWTEPGILEK
ncbi:MAG TPA: aspartate ammonia-lyase [Candidatus Eisenbacteria bacterium]|nr:aspartate ammonia-lyase [Candidatus Eisenbacteria bacterium]